MTATSIPEGFYTYEGRLASFQSATKRRASNAKGKAARSVKWPHKFLAAEELAAAGFYHQPSSEGNDNVTCFLCRKSILGWEKGDVPLIEHLKLSPDCGWAIVASIEANDERLVTEDPASARMVEARTATFADRWPHEHKKGWKCKTKQLVDAGWIYKPTPEYDDMAMCSYCSLGLDGWEPKDDPMEQHYKRNPDCTFFNLMSKHQEEAPKKKKTKGRKPRESKASRLSTQSVLTTNSEAPSFMDLPAEADDSILTTATNTTITNLADPKMPRASRKAGSKKTTTKKNEVIDVVEPENDDFEIKVEQTKKAPRGKKRTSEVLEDSSVIDAAPVPVTKRRATRTRGSLAIADSIPVTSKDTVDTESPMDATAETGAQVLPKPRKGGRTSKVKSSRSASAASKAPLRVPTVDDTELDDALLADLDRQLSEDDNESPNGVLNVKTSRLDSSILQKSPRAASVAPVRKTRVSKVTKASHAMFGPQDVELGDAAIEAELDRMQMQMQQSQPLPKAKGAKARQPRKPSAKQQAAAKRAAEAAEEAKAHEKVEPVHGENEEAEIEQSVVYSSPPHRPKGRKAKAQKTKARKLRASGQTADDSHLSVTDGPVEAPDGAKDFGNDTEASIASASTTIRRDSFSERAKAKKKALPNKTKAAAHAPSQTFETTEFAPSSTVKESPSEIDDVGVGLQTIASINLPVAEENTVVTKNTPTPSSLSEEGSPVSVRQTSEVKSDDKAVSETPAPTETARSLSPQSSDAENRPPSSKPSIVKSVHTTTRTPAVASTPTASPSKRNIIGNLQSSLPWSAVDLDEVFIRSPGSDKENANQVASLLEDAVTKAKRGELTSPEKGMTVEQWINFNAGLAEEKLKNECERMVGIFEREGGRAMRVLEEIGCLE